MDLKFSNKMSSGFDARLFFAALFVLCFFLSSVSYAQDAAPGDACAVDDEIIFSGGPENSGVGYEMVCQGSVWIRITESDTSGNLGVKVASPKTPLDVGGELKIGGSTGLACDADREGALRYNSVKVCYEFCDASSWGCIASASCADTTATAFDFADTNDQVASTVVTSAIEQITGLSCGVDVTISGEGSPEFRTCSDASCASVSQDWNVGPGAVGNNQYMQLRTTTQARPGDISTVTISINQVEDEWNVDTDGDCTGSPAVGTICADGTIYAGTTPDGSVDMYVTRCDGGMYWDGAACAGVRAFYTYNDGHENYEDAGASVDSHITGASNTSVLAALSNGESPYIGADYCDGLSVYGQTDWYLPANDELDVIYTNRVAIGNFDLTQYYMSSTQDSSWSRTRPVYFVDGGNPGGYSKNADDPLRCVRK